MRKTTEKQNKKTFVFRTEWQEILQNYPDQIRLEVYDAVIHYASTGEVPAMRPMTGLAFAFIQKDIENQRIAGCLDEDGKGRKRRSSRRKREQREDDRTDRTGGRSSGGEDSERCNQALYQMIVARWNEVCGTAGLPKILGLTAARRKKIRQRVAEWAKNMGQDVLQTVDRLFSIVKNTPFLCGSNRMGWRASFDWLLKNGTNAMKVFEGNYQSHKREVKRFNKHDHGKTGYDARRSSERTERDFFENTYWETLPGGYKVLRFR